MKKIQVLSFALAIGLMIQNPLFVQAQNISENSVVSIEPIEEENLQQDEVCQALVAIVEQKPILALLYNANQYEVKKQPFSEADVVTTIVSGTQVSIKDLAYAEDGTMYYYVEGANNDNIFQGYIESSHLVTADADFLEWKEKELIKVRGISLEVEGTNLDAIYRNFPKSYWDALTTISTAHPNWIFVPFNSGVDWNTAVAEESKGNYSLIALSSQDDWKSKAPGDYDAATGTYIGKSGKNWVKASDYAISYFMNPFTYLNEQNVFAFEQLTYDQSKHNSSGVAAVLSGTWMAAKNLEDGSGGLYQDVFIQIGAQSGVSPYHLASRVKQEQGISGTAALISGKDGYYNYYNISASGTNETDIYNNGINYARSQGWNTRYKSILGGALYLGSNYITKGQDSLYLQKFDIDNSYYGMFTHQYMQNIQAPQTESIKVYNAYKGAGALNNNFVFKIPIYNNFPANISGMEEFISRLYTVILDRDPDAAGMEYWKSKIQAGSTAAELITGFFDSPEMINRKLDNATFLEYAYKAILGRGPDINGKQSWLSEMELGCTRKYILVGFVESTEFQSICNKYGITKGSITELKPEDKNAGMTKFVVRLYRKILHREPDAEGLTCWTNNLHNGYSASELVEGFVYSQEFINANLSNDDYVEIMYETILGRNSDVEGKKMWMQMLNKGQNRSTVLAGFIYSQEFSDLAQRYGIVVGNLTQ